jgi:hypothetical protein
MLVIEPSRALVTTPSPASKMQESLCSPNFRVTVRHVHCTGGLSPGPYLSGGRSTSAAFDRFGTKYRLQTDCMQVAYLNSVVMPDDPRSDQEESDDQAAGADSSASDGENDEEDE